ncbi:MAG TPA: leucyl aminopeptidase family protein [Thermoanaerobaculia bacterium]|nr:leucyl aminopeptidase family protein [Thermoanaerobaculia bacterium]HUM31060.1 leucyl aminopeptidase family protein [Thermoanaerobaculia bacterium]HXK69358.1 leucyl aminopeptidase family protein [Thermoanaerobaculia bacterium]
MELHKLTKQSNPGAYAFLLAEGADFPDFPDLDPKLSSRIRNLIHSSGFSGKKAEALTIPARDKNDPYILLIGVGKERDLTLQDMDRRFSALLDSLKQISGKRVAVGFNLRLRRIPEEFVFGILLYRLLSSAYRYTAFIKRKPESAPRIFVLRPPAMRKAVFDRVRAEANLFYGGEHFARDLANAPANILSPESFAREVIKADRSGLWTFSLWDRARLEKETMTGTLAIGNSGGRPPCLLHGVLNPEGARRLVLIGKGVIFDSGGISIKPARGMEEMKFDKSGASAVAGLVPILPGLQLQCRVDILLPLAENLLDRHGARPGDILTFRDRTTVEILSTDAEGRLLLADALILAREWKPDLCIDVATLTGACSVALGSLAAGLFTNRDRYLRKIPQIGDRVGEWVWPMPLWKEHERELEGGHAMIKNTGSRYGGAIHAAAFLHRFIGNVPWFHLDIAGTAHTDHTRGRKGGATGWGVALLAKVTEAFDRSGL